MRLHVNRGLVRMLLMALGLAAMLAPLPAIAETADESAGQEADPNGDQGQSLRRNNGFDLTRPQTAFEVRGLDQGSSNETSKTNKAELILRLESKIPLAPDWNLGLLAYVPLVGKTTTEYNSSSVTHEFGIGDTVFQVIVAHAIDDRWAIGGGARVSAQAGADNLGSGEWQTMPGFGVRYMIYEWGPDSFFVPSFRWALSSPTNPGRRRIDEPQIAPTLNIDLPGPFSLTLYPSHDIRINYGTPISGQTGRLFLPFDALIGARLSDKVQVSLEGSVPIVKAYPVYKFKAEARLRIVF